MHKEFEKTINKIISQKNHFPIERILINEKDRDQHSSLFSANVASILKGQINEMYDAKDIAEAAEISRKKLPAAYDNWSKRQLRKHITDKIASKTIGPAKKFDISFLESCRNLVPPYDLQWSSHVLPGSDTLSPYDGANNPGGFNMIVTSKEFGYLAMGIGFYLTTNEPVSASITPQGLYEWEWSSFATQQFTRCRGGLGLTIYTDGETNPTISNQATLFSVTGVNAGQKDSGSGRITDATTPASPYGFVVPLAPAVLNMFPGSQYLVWVWCWTATHIEEAELFMGLVNFHMPQVTICTGAPIPGPR
jgi:hypothetical protein